MWEEKREIGSKREREGERIKVRKKTEFYVRGSRVEETKLKKKWNERERIRDKVMLDRYIKI